VPVGPQSAGSGPANWALCVPPSVTHDPGPPAGGRTGPTASPVGLSSKRTPWPSRPPRCWRRRPWCRSSRRWRGLVRVGGAHAFELGVGVGEYDVVFQRCPSAAAADPARLPPACFGRSRPRLGAGEQPSPVPRHEPRRRLRLNRTRVRWRCDRTVAALLVRLDREPEVRLGRGMPFPTSWHPYFAAFMTLEDIYRYPARHYGHHRVQLTPRANPPMTPHRVPLSVSGCR
jgi:hypothetical protein